MQNSEYLSKISSLRSEHRLYGLTAVLSSVATILKATEGDATSLLLYSAVASIFSAAYVSTHSEVENLNTERINDLEAKIEELQKK